MNAYESLGKEILRAAAVLLASGGELLTETSGTNFFILGVKHTSGLLLHFPVVETFSFTDSKLAYSEFVAAITRANLS